MRSPSPAVERKRNGVQHLALRIVDERNFAIEDAPRRESGLIASVRVGSSSSGRSAITCRVRSRPASASEIWVPMLTTLTMGATRDAKKGDTNSEVIALEVIDPFARIFVRAKIHDDRADQPHQHGGRERHNGHCSKALPNVIEQALHAFAANTFASRSSA